MMSITSLMSLLNIFSEGLQTLELMPKHIRETEKRRIINKLELLLEQVKEF
jgi:hypothetical protein